MGKYINNTSDGKELSALGKASALISDGAELLVYEPKEWEEGLVCVVANGPFDAAAYAYNKAEMEAFQDPSDERPKVWLRHPRAKELAK